MYKDLKEPYAKVLSYVIKLDKDEISHQEASLFCELISENFSCNVDEAKEFLDSKMVSNEEFEEALETINKKLKSCPIEKMHLLEQINHIIYVDGIQDIEYKEGFEKVKKILFPAC